MRSGKWYLLHIVLLTVAISGLFNSGCKKYDGFLNENVIRTPYPLYFDDRLGAMYNTNDAKAYKVVFPADGVPARAILTSGPNLMWIKYNDKVRKNGTVFLSTDNGRHFNPVDTFANPSVTWQNQIVDVPSLGRVYLASVRPSSPSIEYSDDHGLTWNNELLPPTIPGGFTAQSFTELTNGELYVLDYTGPRLLKRGAGTIGGWSEVTMTTALPAGKFQLAHINNVLIAADLDGLAGVWYSSDFGVTWQAYTGLPGNHKIYIAAGPLNRVVLAGLENEGIYRLVGTSFVPSNNGLEPNTTVYSIVGKQDIYKNDVIKQYIYIATSKGLFRSEDLGQNWVQMRAGEYRNVY